MMKTIIILSALFSSQCFCAVGNIPERFRYHYRPWTDAQAKEVLFSARVGEVIGRRVSVPIFAKNVFRDSRPLDKKQYQEMISSLGQDISVTYNEYIQQWLAEKVAPSYFKEILNIMANNNSVPERLINNVIFNIQTMISTNITNANEPDLIKNIRMYVEKDLIIKLGNLQQGVWAVDGQEMGNHPNTLVIDFSPIYKDAIDKQVADEDFYRKWVSFTTMKIKEYFQAARRLKVVEEQIQLELNKDPLFLYSTFPGDAEVIYNKILSLETSFLKQGNYTVNVLKVNLRKNQIKPFNIFLKDKTKINDIDSINTYLMEKQITNIKLDLDKFGENTFEKKYHLPIEKIRNVWDPMRILKGEISIIDGKYDGEIFLALGTKKNGEYVFALESGLAKKEIRKNLLMRKRKILYKRVADRLVRKFPLVLDIKGCYVNDTFCYGEGFVNQMNRSIVKVNGPSDLREYLKEIDSSLFEQAIY